MMGPNGIGTKIETSAHDAPFQPRSRASWYTHAAMPTGVVNRSRRTMYPKPRMTSHFMRRRISYTMSGVTMLAPTYPTGEPLGMDAPLEGAQRHKPCSEECPNPVRRRSAPLHGSLRRRANRSQVLRDTV